MQTLAMAGKPEQAAAVGDALVDRLDARASDPARLVDVLVVLARAAVTAGDHARAQAMIERAHGLTDVLDDAVAARLDAVGAHVALEQDRLDDARTLAHAAIERARRDGAAGRRV